jgi:hypothetical protein
MKTHFAVHPTSVCTKRSENTLVSWPVPPLIFVVHWYLVSLHTPMNRDELVQLIYLERIEEDSEIFFEAYCPYCRDIEECMVDHGKDQEARAGAVRKMLDHLREAHKVTIVDESNEA